MENTLDKLKAASEGLFFMSESDYPFETVSFPKEKLPELTPEKLLQVLGLPATTITEKQDITYFLRNQTRELPEFSADEIVRAKKFQELEKTIIQKLKDAAVFRLGKVQVDAYILGVLPEGNFGGLKTKLIET